MALVTRSGQVRVFKTRAFAKLATKARINDQALWKAAIDLADGKGDNLGGNVWKKRLNHNMHRSIVVERVGRSWFFVFLFAKKDRVNIDDAELQAFKLLAKQFAKMSGAQLHDQLAQQELQEIFSDG